MRHRCLIRTLALATSLSAALASAAPPEKPPPRRVASLNLTADEILAEILPADRLAAVTSFIDERGTSNAVGLVPPSVPRLPKADLERLVALSPDLVVVSEYTDADTLRLLEASGLRTHRMQGLRSLPGFRANLLELGRAVGAEEAAQRLAKRYDAVLEELARRLRGVRRPRVLYWATSVTAGADTAISSLVEAAGGINVGTELRLHGIVPLSAERAFVANPDVVLVGSGFGNVESVRSHPLLSKLRASQEGRIVEMPTELLVALSHHAARACWHLAHLLHPDRIPEERP